MKPRRREIILLLSTVVASGACVFNCHECTNCPPDVEGTSTRCATNSTSCYYMLDVNKQVTRSCGNEELDRISAHGCTLHEDDSVTCRCDEDLCNVNSWICFFCFDCGHSIGRPRTCGIDSFHGCFMITEPNGTVTRTCGAKSIERSNLRDGCTTFSNNKTICQCSSLLCNKHMSDFGPSYTYRRPRPTTSGPIVGFKPTILESVQTTTTRKSSTTRISVTTTARPTLPYHPFRRHSQLNQANGSSSWDVNVMWLVLFSLSSFHFSL